jgi:hypothetical protein
MAQIPVGRRGKTTVFDGESGEDRAERLRQTRNLKMARSAHAYVRGSTVKFYEMA